MATQTGSIDLTASNSVKLAAEAGWQSDLDDYYTKSEIDVTVGGINSEVSKKVNGTEIISSINQSAESVSINANKINLQGAVTISDLSSDAQSATLNSNISVGGRNYAKTRDSIGTTSTVNGVTFTVAGPSTVTVNGTATATSIPSQAWFGGLTLDPGTYSLWLTNTNGGTLWFRLGKGASRTHVWSTSGDYSRETPYVFTVSESDTYWFGPVCSAGTYSNVETRYMLEKGNKATDWTPAPEDQTAYVDDSISSIQVGGRNLLKANDAVHTPANYNAHMLYLAEPIEDGVPYILQLWDVDVSHTGKSAATLGVNVYYCGGSVTFGGWIGTGYFTNGHADHLELRFTAYTSGATISSGGSVSPSPTNALAHSTVVNKTKKYITLYNSAPSATGTMNLTVGKWKLEKGDTATDWSPAPEDVDSAISDAAKTATSYVTDINSNGITVHPSRSDYATNGGRAVINGDGLTVYLGSDDVASYGASARIGKANSDRVTVDSTDGITIYKGNSKRLQTTANGIDVYGSDGATSIASFGATARIGKSNGTRVIIDTSEVKIIPSNKTNNALTFTATDDSARIDYGSNYLSIGDVEFGYDCALGVLGDVWVSSGGSLNVGSSAAYGNPKFTVTSAGGVRASGAIYATDDPTDTSDPSLVAGLVGTSSFIVLRADEGSAGNRWRFNKAGRDIGYYNGTDWDTVCPMPAMTAAISGQTNKSLTTSYANLTLAAVTTVASALTISGGGVKCTKAGRVMISGAAYFEGVSAGNVCNVKVLIGTTEVAFVSDRAYSDRCQMVIPPRITTVAANDVLYMAVANTSGATGSVKGARTQTWLTVQYVAYN